MSMSIEHWRNYAGGGEIPKYLDKNLFICYFISHKHHVDWLSIQSGPLW
jgi:hypothetical protein